MKLIDRGFSPFDLGQPGSLLLRNRSLALLVGQPLGVPPLLGNLKIKNRYEDLSKIFPAAAKEHTKISIFKKV